MSYVVTRPFRDSNVGSNLASLAGALWLARTLSREVIVDWRDLSQLRDPTLNYFTEFFEAPRSLADVDVSYAPTARAGPYEEQIPDSAVSPSEARALGAGADVRAEPIVLQAYHGLDRVHPGPEADRLRLLKAFYASLRPGPEVRAAVDEWWQANLAGAFVIGVNVRTGNGHYFGAGRRYASRVDVSVFDNQRRFLAKLERACRACARAGPEDAQDRMVIFYATDSAPMSELLSTLPHAVTRRSVYPPPDTGDTYRFEDETDRVAIVDTLADMFLLARCNALIYNSSLFNQYARVSTGDFGGNLTHLESLFLRGRVRQLRQGLRRRLHLH